MRSATMPIVSLSMNMKGSERGAKVTAERSPIRVGASNTRRSLIPPDIPRFKKLGIIPSMQPSHAIGDLHFRAQPSRDWSV